MSSHDYIIKLIQCIREKPVLWDARSRRNTSHEVVHLQWKLVAAEMRAKMNCKEIRESDVMYSWNSLIKVYHECYSRGNGRSFKYFEPIFMFIRPVYRWYDEPAIFFEQNSEAAYILKTQLGLNIMFAVIFTYLVMFHLNGQYLTTPYDLPGRIFLLSVVFFGLSVLVPLMYSLNDLTRLYSNKSVPFQWSLVIVPVISYLLEKMHFTCLVEVTQEIRSSVAFFTLSCVVIASGFAVNYGNWVKRPFPPSRFRAFWRSIVSVAWIYVLCAVNGIMNASLIFYTIPLCLAINSFISVYFINYLWSNKDTIYPLLNEAPYEVVAQTKYRLNFKQKENIWQNDII